MPLPELSNYINSHRHLPNIPSALEIQRDGINMAEMTSKLLGKIEELTLYLFQQDSLIESQKKVNDSQQLQIDELKKMIMEMRK
jgi:hypothetical protein